MKRYGRLKSEYEETKSKAREALKTGDYKYYEYKGKAKRQKKYVKQAYKDLKRYSKIDKGAKLYAQGKRIHENGRKMTLVMMASSGGMYMSKFIKDRKVRTAVQAGIGVVSALVEGQTMYENDKLRAYYGRYEGGLKLDKKKGEVYKI